MQICQRLITCRATTLYISIVDHQRRGARVMIKLLGSIFCRRGARQPEVTRNCECSRPPSDNKPASAPDSERRKRRSPRPVIIILSPCCHQDCPRLPYHGLPTPSTLAEVSVPELDGAVHRARRAHARKCSSSLEQRWY